VLPVAEGTARSLGMELVPAGVAYDLLRVDRWIPNLGRSPVCPRAHEQGRRQD
jgi:hypothetical protein